jgi:hypothetical protein
MGFDSMSLNKTASKLQGELANIDFRTRPISGFPEFLVVQSQALQIKIKMYEEDGPHKCPHIHIDYGKGPHVAAYAIENGSRIVGNFSRKYDRAIAHWILRYRSDLMEAWRQTQSGKKPEWIIAKLKGTFD